MYLPPPKFVGDMYHPKDCTNDLTGYQYTYSNNASNSQIAVADEFYSKPNSTPPVNTINPLINDPEYKLEGDPPDEPTTLYCDPAVNDCRNTDIDGKNPFRYRVYYPKETVHNYTAKPLPCIVMLHPGGFIECSDNLQPMTKQLGEEFSRKGFIYFTVEYRRGRAKDTDTTKTTVQQQMASYRAILDGCGAIRSIIKKNRDGSFPFKIDESQFFIGGASAGGVVAMGCAYYRTSDNLVTDQSMIDKVFKKAAGSTYTMQEVLGKMHNDDYYAPAAAQYWPVIKGVICMWSGIAIPYGVTEKNFFKTTTETSSANPPMIAFHGDDDIVFPFYDDNPAQNLNLSPFIIGQDNYNSENLCTNLAKTFVQYIDPDPLHDNPELKMCSSFNMYKVLKALNRFTELYLDCDMGHGLDSSCVVCPGPAGPPDKKVNNEGSCSPCVFDSNFGNTAFSNTQQVTTYMAQRIAVFFQTIMNYTDPNRIHPPFNYTNSRSFFKECVNNRKCGQGNNNTCTTAASDTRCDGTELNLE